MALHAQVGDSVVTPDPSGQAIDKGAEVQVDAHVVAPAAMESRMSASPLRPGIVSALVTPFAPDGSVDKRALDALVDPQVESGLDGLFVLGTSGEGMLLSVRNARK